MEWPNLVGLVFMAAIMILPLDKGMVLVYNL